MCRVSLITCRCLSPAVSCPQHNFPCTCDRDQGSHAHRKICCDHVCFLEPSTSTLRILWHDRLSEPNDVISRELVHFCPCRRRLWLPWLPSLAPHGQMTASVAPFPARPPTTGLCLAGPHSGRKTSCFPQIWRSLPAAEACGPPLNPSCSLTCQASEISNAARNIPVDVEQTGNLDQGKLGKQHGCLPPCYLQCPRCHDTAPYS